MKKNLSIFLTFMMIVMFASAGYAAVGQEKLAGGFKKIFESPIQLKDGIVNEYNAAKFKPFGVLGGALKGLFYTGKEVVTGLLEVVTFPEDFDKK